MVPPRWRTRSQFEEFKEKLSKTNFRLRDPSYESWIRDIRGTKSNIEVVCVDCELIAKPQLGAFLKTWTSSCACNRRASVSTRLYYERMCTKLSLSQWDFQPSVSSFADWQRIATTQHSKIPLRCSVCVVDCTPTISNFMTKGRAACLCTSNMAICSSAYYDHVKRVVETSRYLLVNVSSYEDWQRDMIDKNSAIVLECTTCRAKGDTSLSNFMRTKSSPCFCDGSLSVKNESYFERFSALVEQGRFASSVTTFPEWLATVNSVQSHVELTCTVCKRQVFPKVHHFMRGSAGRCDCSVQVSEGRVGRLLDATVNGHSDDCTVHAEFAFSELRGIGGRPLKFDFAILKGSVVKLLVEVDGVHHFQRDWAYGTDSTNNALEHDLSKEVHAMLNGIPIARVQTSVVHRNLLEWNRWLQGIATAAMEDAAKLGVYRLGSGYFCGEYQMLRQNMPEIRETCVAPGVEGGCVDFPVHG